MTDILLKCDRFKCTVSPQTPKGTAWMLRYVYTIADSNIAIIDEDTAKDFEKELDKAGITHRRC